MIWIVVSDAFAVELPLNSAKVYSKVHEWLEWEQPVLRPAVYCKDAAQLPSVLQTLQKAVASSGGRFLVGAQHSLADIAIFSTLFHLRNDDSIPAAVTEYLKNLAQLPPFAEGIQKVQS